MVCHIGQDICSITSWAYIADAHAMWTGAEATEVSDGLIWHLFPGGLQLLDRGATEVLRVDLEAAKSEAEAMQCRAENAEEDCCAG